ncbi:hypothetical protein JB92DRAFT_1069529 [Gautieria morchelliformis]|nr:hypothetical protein JB92DRAFT_1069529 [Gautieria morchelliformis]
MDSSMGPLRDILVRSFPGFPLHRLLSLLPLRGFLRSSLPLYTHLCPHFSAPPHPSPRQSFPLSLSSVPCLLRLDSLVHHFRWPHLLSSSFVLVASSPLRTSSISSRFHRSFWSSPSTISTPFLSDSPPSISTSSLFGSSSPSLIDSSFVIGCGRSSCVAHFEWVVAFASAFCEDCQTEYANRFYMYGRGAGSTPRTLSRLHSSRAHLVRRHMSRPQPL